MFSLACQSCDSAFETEWSGRKYCSIACGAKARTRITARPCAWCGVSFKPTNSNIKCCSRKCADALRTVGKYDLTCKQCGVGFQSYRESPFCSRACYFDSKRNDQVKTCGHCGVALTGAKSRQQFCSVKCGALNRAPSMKHPRLTEAREKPCEYCGEMFGMEQCQNNIAKFRARRFCSKKCSAKATRPRGEAHPAWKPGLKQRSTRGPAPTWSRAVKKRDRYICQGCGQHGGRLEAHHIFEFAKFPDKRWELSNGITLCFACHRDIHGKIRRVVNKKGVNSVEPYGNVRPVDNTEPSRDGNVSEGVTTRDRAYGTWQGACAECGVMFQRPWTQVRAKLPYVYCCTSCAARARQRIRYASDTAVMSPRAPSAERRRYSLNCTATCRSAGLNAFAVTTKLEKGHRSSRNRERGYAN